MQGVCHHTCRPCGWPSGKRCACTVCVYTYVLWKYLRVGSCRFFSLSVKTWRSAVHPGVCYFQFHFKVWLPWLVQDAGLQCLTAMTRALSVPLQASGRGKGDLEEFLDMVLKGELQASLCSWYTVHLHLYLQHVCSSDSQKGLYISE